MMGEYLVKHMGPKGKVAILMGTPGAPNLEERKNGLLDYLKDYPDVKVVATEFCYDDVNKGVSVMEAVMQAHPDLKGWVLAGSWAIFTPAPGPFSSKKPGDLTVIAFDALPEELEYVRQGYVQVLLGQKLWGWGYESVRALIEIKEGKTPPAIIDSGLDVVTKENVEEYAQKWRTGKF
jgi:ribose transport system substrate-binding protein